MIGAWAMAFHGKPRYTGDLDIFFNPSAENAERFLAALRDFGVPTSHIQSGDLEAEGTTLTFGVPPRRIDALNRVSGLSWDEAAKDAVPGHLGDVPVKFLSLRAIRINKAAADRPRDRADLEELTQP